MNRAISAMARLILSQRSPYPTRARETTVGTFYLLRAIAPRTMVPSPSKSMKRILVIEDDQRIVTALWIRLKKAGYDVVTASDGLKGLTSAIEARPDLIVLDIWLP